MPDYSLMDVDQSIAWNPFLAATLHELSEKQNDQGDMQLRLAIDVARPFVREEAAKYVDESASGRSPIQGGGV